MQLRSHGTVEHVAAVELTPAEATKFYSESLPEFVARFPIAGRFFARVLFGLVAPELPNGPERASRTHPVFELRKA